MLLIQYIISLVFIFLYFSYNESWLVLYNSVCVGHDNGNFIENNFHKSPKRYICG